jgi:hypothetical protein
MEAQPSRLSDLITTLVKSSSKLGAMGVDRKT